MKKGIIERPFKKFDQSKLDELESILGEKLPDDYVEFLKKYNGGYVSDINSFNFIKSSGTKTSNCVDTFYGILDSKNADNGLLTNIRFVMGRLPKDCLSIASLVFGDELCLVFKGPNKGKIYFWDHETEADPDQGETPDYSNMSLIANSFTEFINNLYRYELPEDES